MNNIGEEEEFFGGQDGERYDEFTLRQVSKKLENDGYRISKQQAEDRQLQAGFNEGFRIGMALGKECSKFYASCRMKYSTAQYAVCIDSIESILFKKLAETSRLSDDDFTALRENAIMLGQDLENVYIEFRESYEAICKLES